MSDTPELRLTHFMLKWKRSQTDPAAAKGASCGAMTASASMEKTSTSGKGGSITASAPGGVLDCGKLKVNFVPVEQLKEIVGIGDTISKRMHMLCLSQGNLNATKLKEEFGRKMAAAMLSQMDFVINDMLIDRNPDIDYAKLKPNKFEDDFSSGSDTEYELKAVKQTSGGKAHVDEVEEEPEEKNESEEGSAPAAVAKRSKKKVSHRRRHKHNNSTEDVVDEIEVKPRTKSKSKKSVNIKEKENPKNQIKRKPKRKLVPVKMSNTSNTGTSDSSDEDVSLRKVPKGFDRHLRFAVSIDGKGDDFDSFKLKFKSYAKVFN
ncbi:hypothetical protein DPMN_016880 [Dreissena polymorpha]|uniref:Uncharacterized protein n=1 Tax=Dreissena polymorpha TaxID=45954 RepID=A0A9D4NGG1_DREPO|nr:hypothetical protein DPMN_016880 [Dreissena polymorpha]